MANRGGKKSAETYLPRIRNHSGPSTNQRDPRPDMQQTRQYTSRGRITKGPRGWRPVYPSPNLEPSEGYKLFDDYIATHRRPQNPLKMSRQWILTGQEGFETSLEYQQNVKAPSAGELGPKDVLVQLHAASLNYRELVIAGPAGINGPINPPIVPGCDGAGVVKAVGSAVQEFHVGDRVITYLAPKLAERDGDDALAGLADAVLCLGQGDDGTLRSDAVFPEVGLVHAPKSLGWLPAATLSCNWTTAWNAFFGLKGHHVGPESWVLVQGTGGVSIASLQLAAAAGANVVATTSSDEKAARLKALGAKHTINYRTSPDSWGHEARSFTPDGRGFDFVIDIGGNETLAQSLASVRVDGLVQVVGGVGANADAVPLFSVLLHTCLVRGILAGSRTHLKEAVRFIDEKRIVPAIDDVVFELAEAKEAYRRLKEKKHFAKVVIKIDHPEA